MRVKIPQIHIYMAHVQTYQNPNWNIQTKKQKDIFQKDMEK